MPPSALASRLSIFSGSRRSKKAVVVADTDGTLANTPSVLVIPPPASESSTDPATAAIATMEAEPGSEPPSIWLTDPTNARITGKALDVAVPTVSYEWPKAETNTSVTSNPIGLLVSRFRRKVTKKPIPEKSSASSGSPPPIQSTTTADANTGNPPPWTPSVIGPPDPNNAAANAPTVPRERRYRTLGQGLRSKFVRTASSSTTTRSLASLYRLRKKSQSSVNDQEGAERKPDETSVNKESSVNGQEDAERKPDETYKESSEAIASVGTDTVGQPRHEDVREGGAENEIREEDFEATTNAGLAAVHHRSILKTDEWVDPRAGKVHEKKPSIRFVDPLPRRPDPLPEPSRNRILQRRARGRGTGRSIVSVYNRSSWVADAVLARSKDLSEEHCRAEEWYRSLMEDTQFYEGEGDRADNKTEEGDETNLETPGLEGGASGYEEQQGQHQSQEMSSPASASPTRLLVEGAKRAEEVVDSEPRMRDSSLDCKVPPETVARPSNPIPGTTSFISDAARPQYLNPVEVAENSDGIEEVPRSPAQSMRSGVAGVEGGGDELELERSSV